MLCWGAWAGEVTGRVFIDADADGRWDEGERPLAGALVSDGLSIVATAADGTYTLQSPDGPQVIFVVNPEDTWPLQGFHRYVQVGPATVDFPMQQQEQEVPFYFVQGTDLHVRTDPAVVAQVQRYVNAVNSIPLPIAFVVHTGDLVVDTNHSTVEEARALFQAYLDMMAGFKMPLINLPGNHEHVAVFRDDVPPDTPGWGKGLYREMIGPTHFAFTWAGVHFIAMDGTTTAGGVMKYGIPDECMAWLREYLSYVDPSRPIVMLVHEPFQTLARKAEVERALEGRRVLLALSGHGHGIAYWPFADTTEIMGGATSYAWHGSGFGPNPMGYHVIRITEDGFEDAFADWAERYSVTIRKPARSAILTGPTVVDAALFDPADEVTSAQVALGDDVVEITDFGSEGLYRTFTTTLDASGLVDGFHDLVVTLHGTGEPEVERQPFLALTGTQEPFTTAVPATLRFRVQRVEAADRVLVNGVEVATIPPDAKDRELVTAEVPAALLRRTNAVEFVSGPMAGEAGWDEFQVLSVELIHEGRSYTDFRYRKATPVAIKPGDGEAGRATFYIDLTRPEQ